MMQFYCAYSIRYSLRSELSWTHYRVLMRISNEERRNWYTEECAKSNWSVRQLERQIHTLLYERLLSSIDEYKETVALEMETTEPKP